MFEVVARGGMVTELESLMDAALDELLETARLSTVQRWCDLASAESVGAPIFSVASAEVMLRHGRHVEAMAHAEAAAGDDLELAFRALCLAGRAAHLASREEDALDLYRRAEEAAATEDERRNAMWGQLMCLIDLEHSSAEQTLQSLLEGITIADPREMVRAATYRTYLQLRSGAIDLHEADFASQLLAVVDDPLVESSFLSGYAIALALSARYKDAGAASADLLAIAERCRLTFAIPYGLCGSAMSHSGFRQWDEAGTAVQDALHQASSRRDVHAQLLSASILLRVLLQQGRIHDALDTALPDSRGALDASIAEVSCCRALALACAGRGQEALEVVEACPPTTAVEPVVLSAAVRAVVSLKSRSPDAADRVLRLERVAFAVGALDLLVVSYRACPELLTVLLRAVKTDRVRDLIIRTGDVELAAAVGHPLAVGEDRAVLLSPRERDVYELLRTGLTNRQIAKLLFIEESTVKVHVHHIFDKLEVRSRTALAVQAALQRSNQATSATASTGSGDDS